MEAMPRPRPPHLHRQVTRHGKTVWYVRLGKGHRIRIRAAFGTPEFDVEYHAAIATRLPPSSKRALSAGTLAWLIERYRETAAWRDLSLATRQQREAILAHVIKSAGSQPFAQITRHNHPWSRSQTRYTSSGAAFSRNDARALSMGYRRTACEG
jgi:hypothetical protein